MRKHAGIVLALVFLLIGISGILATSIEAEDSNKVKTTVSLSHTVSEKYTPDKAMIIFGVKTENQSLDYAFEQNNIKINKVYDKLEGNKAVQDIKTLNFTVNSFYQNNHSQVRTKKYRVVNRIQVEITDLERIGNIIQNGINSGANQVMNINYKIADKKIIKEKLRTKAMQELQTKIESIADFYKKDRIELQTLNLNNNFNRISYNKGMSMGRVQSNAESLSMPPQISPQDLQVTISLSASFVLYDK